MTSAKTSPLVARLRVSYLRVSTEEQREQQTIEVQRTGIERDCKARNVSLDKTYEDDGVSGTLPLASRPQGRRLLEDARAGRISEVVIWAWDRFGRDLLSFLAACEELSKLGIQVRCVTQPTTDDDAGRFLRNMHAVFAEHERSRIIERSKAGSRRLAEAGVWLGGIVPYGYRQQGDDRAARLIPSTEVVSGRNYSEVDVVRRVFQSAAEGKSCVAIANDLNRDSVPTVYGRDKRLVLGRTSKQRTPGRWRAARVRALIVNRTYMGVHEWGKRRVFRDNAGRHLMAAPREQWLTRPCHPIVDKLLWERANAALKQNQIVAMAHAKNDYLLRGLIRCSCCQLNYLGCGNYYRRRVDKEALCSAPSIRRVDLEGAVWSEIEVFLAKPGATIRALQRQMGTGDDAVRRTQEEIKNCNTALTRKSEARQRVISLYAEGVLQRAEFDLQIQRINDDRTALEQELTALRKASTDREATARALNDAGDLLGRLRSKLDKDLPFQERRRIVEALVAGITVESVPGETSPKVTVRYNFDPHFERYQKWGRTREFTA